MEEFRRFILDLGKHVELSQLISAGRGEEVTKTLDTFVEIMRQRGHRVLKSERKDFGLPKSLLISEQPQASESDFVTVAKELNFHYYRIGTSYVEY